MKNTITATKRFAYTPVVTPSGYVVGKAIEGEYGWEPGSNRHFETYDHARRIADGLNKDLGLTTKDAWVITASSMRLANR